MCYRNHYVAQKSHRNHYIAHLLYLLHISSPVLFIFITISYIQMTKLIKIHSSPRSSLFFTTFYSNDATPISMPFVWIRVHEDVRLS